MGLPFTWGDERIRSRARNPKKSFKRDAWCILVCNIGSYLIESVSVMKRILQGLDI